MKKQSDKTYEDIISVKNLLEAWREFIKGKCARRDVQEFSLRLMDNIFALHEDLLNHTYCHGSYQAFNISDPKPRNIHKATMRDQLLHHAIHRKLYPFFDRTFVVDSYSCRKNKGIHRAINQFRKFARKVSKNNTKTCWVLKCDIRKFFANIDHKILLEILREYISDENIARLIREVIESFNTKEKIGTGLPLGNLTSQLFVNIYMNKFDKFLKHSVKVWHYIRYADDFVVFSENKKWLEHLICTIAGFLRNELKLELHPDKVFIKTLASGVDFLGWIHFPDHRILRTGTKRRMFTRMKGNIKPQAMQSYLGLLKYGNAHKITQALMFYNQSD